MFDLNGLAFLLLVLSGAFGVGLRHLLLAASQRAGGAIAG